MSITVKKILIPITVLLLIIFCIWIFDLESLLSIDSFKSFKNSHGFWSVVIFIATFSLSVIFLLPASILSVLAGMFFGSLLGSVYSMIGVMIGAVVSFYIARHYGQSFVEKLTHKRFDKVKNLETKISQNGFSTVLFCRLTPLIPFKVPNYILGLTKIKFTHYFWATFIGMMPETFVLVYFGSSLSTLSPLKIGSALVLVSLFCVLGFYYKDKIFKI